MGGSRQKKEQQMRAPKSKIKVDVRSILRERVPAGPAGRPRLSLSKMDQTATLIEGIFPFNPLWLAGLGGEEKIIHPSIFIHPYLSIHPLSIHYPLIHPSILDLISFLRGPPSPRSLSLSLSQNGSNIYFNRRYFPFQSFVACRAWGRRENNI